MTVIRYILRRLGRDRSKRDCVLYRGMVLPPQPMRKCTVEFKDDAYFLDSASRDVEKLILRAGLTERSRVLDIGCGPGRLLIGVLHRLGKVASYQGIDVDVSAINWCRQHLQPRFAGAAFSHLDLYNERYNPAGTVHISDSFRFPVADASVDVIHLYSVFTHMIEEEIDVYLREFKRVLAPGGQVFATAYLEQDVDDDFAIDPEGYRGETDGALHRVRFRTDYFNQLVEHHGLTIQKYDYAAEWDGQTGLYLAHKQGGRLAA